MEITGKVIQILPTQTGVSKSGNEWSKLSFVIETQEEYSHKVAIDLFGADRIGSNKFKVDDVVTVSFDLESREFSGKWYTNVNAWKVVPAQAQPAAHAAPTADQFNVQQTEDSFPF